ncbi:MAG: hypothetical protein ACJAYU_000203 [Bradymonadia bacterium]
MNDRSVDALPARELMTGTRRDTDAGVVYGGDGTRTTMICGHFEYDRAGAHPLWSALPDCLVVREAPDSLVASATKMTVAAAASTDPGTTAVVERLAEILLIQIVRAYALEKDLADGFVAALANESIARALAAVHTGPGAN